MTLRSNQPFDILLISSNFEGNAAGLVVNGDGTATIYAITSTVSGGGGDQDADPNALVSLRIGEVLRF